MITMHEKLVTSVPGVDNVQFITDMVLHSCTNRRCVFFGGGGEGLKQFTKQESPGGFQFGKLLDTVL
jgi:hypothetical protein